MTYTLYLESLPFLMTPSLSILVHWMLRNRGLNVGSHVHLCTSRPKKTIEGQHT